MQRKRNWKREEGEEWGANKDRCRQGNAIYFL